MDQSQLKWISDSISNILESRLRDSYVPNSCVRPIRSAKLAPRTPSFIRMIIRYLPFCTFLQGIAS